MNRLLLQEWLDELRSDDSVELTESQKHPHGKKRNSPHHGNRAAPSLDGSSRGFPDSSRSTASSTPALTERRRQSIVNVTNDVKRKILNYLNGDRKIDEKDYKRAIGDLRATFSLEYKGGSSYGPIATPSGIMGLRVADHRAVGEHFPQNEGDFYMSIYIGEGEAAHIPTAVPYKEFYCPKVLFDRNPKKVLRAAVGIVLNAIETGELVDKTATFTMKDYPVEVPQGAQAAIPTQAGLSPQPPATPPTGPGVLESLAAKYFKEAHNMKYRLLIEAALEELIHEDWMGYSPEERHRLNRWQRSDIRDAEPYIPQAMIRGKTRRKSDSGEYTGPIIPAGQEFMERRRADALDPLFSQCLRYLRAMDKTSGEYQEMKDLMKQGRYREALRRFSQYDEFHFTPEYDEEERKRAKGEYGEYPDFGHADLNNPDVDAAFRDRQI